MPPTLPRLSSFLRQPPLASSPSPQLPLTGSFVPTVRPLEPMLQQFTHRSPPLYDTTTDSSSSSAEQCFSDSHSARPSLLASTLPSESHTHRSREPSHKRKSNSSPSAAFPVSRRQASPPLPLPVAAAPLTISLADNNDSSRTHKSLSSYHDSHTRVLSPSASVSGSSYTNSSHAPRQRTSRYLSEGDRRDIIRRIESGEKQVSLAKEYMVSRAAICNLYKNRREVLTRVDRDPDAKHPKKQRPKPLDTGASPAAEVAPTALPSLSGSGRHEADRDDSLMRATHSDCAALVELRRSVDEPSALELKPEASAAPQQPEELEQPLLRTRLSPSTFQRPLQPVAPLIPAVSRGPSPPPLLSLAPLQAHTQRHTMLPPSHFQQPRLVPPFRVHDASAHSMPLKKLLRSLSNGQTPVLGFRHQADRMLRLLVEEALGCIPMRETDAVTPRGDPFSGVASMDEREICAVAMEAAHSGPVLLQAFAAVQPLSPTGVITLAQTSKSSWHTEPQQQRSDAWTIHAQLPPLQSGQVLLLFDLLCATGERACSVLHHLVHDVRIAPSNVYFVTVNSALGGLQRVHQCFPDVVLVTAQMDTVVDAQHRIRPGIGDFLERYWHPHYEHPPPAHHSQYYERHHESLRAQYPLHVREQQQQQARMQTRHTGVYQRHSK